MLEMEQMVRLAGALWVGRLRLEPKLRAHAAAMGRGGHRPPDGTATVDYLRGARRRLRAAVAATRRDLTTATTPEQVGRAVTSGTEALLDLAAEIRRQTVEPDLRPAQELTARLADHPLAALDSFVARALRSLEPGHAPLEELVPGAPLGLDADLDRRLRALLDAGSPDAQP